MDDEDTEEEEEDAKETQCVINLTHCEVVAEEDGEEEDEEDGCNDDILFNVKLVQKLVFVFPLGISAIPFNLKIEIDI